MSPAEAATPMPSRSVVVAKDTVKGAPPGGRNAEPRTSAGVLGTMSPAAVVAHHGPGA